VWCALLAAAHSSDVRMPFLCSFALATPPVFSFVWQLLWIGISACDQHAANACFVPPEHDQAAAPESVLAQHYVPTVHCAVELFRTLLLARRPRPALLAGCVLICCRLRPVCCTAGRRLA
jgi:hypothetical protein